MPDPNEALQLVRDDVTEGIGRWLLSSDDLQNAGFRVLEPFDDEPEPVRSPATGTVVVPWAWVGRHEEDVMGYLPTHQVVELRGVTLVRDTPDGPGFTRFVDWVSALAQMGITMATRPIEDDPASVADIDLD
jgi:hypothetical protein